MGFKSFQEGHWQNSGKCFITISKSKTEHPYLLLQAVKFFWAEGCDSQKSRGTGCWWVSTSLSAGMVRVDGRVVIREPAVASGPGDTSSHRRSCDFYHFGSVDMWTNVRRRDIRLEGPFIGSCSKRHAEIQAPWGQGPWLGYLSVPDTNTHILWRIRHFEPLKKRFCLDLKQNFVIHSRLKKKKVRE